MSANRSVQAAQRRRMGQEMSSSNNARGPQPSINSSQIFNGQQKQIPQYQQQQYQQQQYQQQQYSSGHSQDSSTGKMTITQAITLITLRLGALETKMMNSPETNGFEHVGEIDKTFLEAVMARLESLEKRSTSLQSSSSSSTLLTNDLNILKQQVEPIKNATIQCKNAVVSITKENKDLKHQIENLKQELHETKILMENIQNMVINLNNKLLMMPMEDTETNDFSQLDFGNIEYMSDNIECENYENIDTNNEIVGTNLKELIEREINYE